MIESILLFLSANKLIVTGAAATISELTVIIVNMLRRMRASKRRLTTMSADCCGGECKPKSRLKTLAWTANPINLFRKA